MTQFQTHPDKASWRWAEVSNNLLPKGTCFPLKRPSTKTPAVGQPLASALDGKPGFFAPETMKNVLEQKMLGWWSDVVDGCWWGDVDE